MQPHDLPALLAAFDKAMHTGAFEEAQAALAAVYAAVGDTPGQAWAISSVQIKHCNYVYSR